MTSSGEKTEGSAGKGTTDHPHPRSGRCCRCLQNTQPGVMGGPPHPPAGPPENRGQQSALRAQKCTKLSLPSPARPRFSRSFWGNGSVYLEKTETTFPQLSIFLSSKLLSTRAGRPSRLQTL